MCAVVNHKIISCNLVLLLAFSYASSFRMKDLTSLVVNKNDLDYERKDNYLPKLSRSTNPISSLAKSNSPKKFSDESEFEQEFPIDEFEFERIRRDDKNLHSKRKPKYKTYTDYEYGWAGGRFG